VAVDNHYELWGAFANRSWPALYFADADGVIRDQHFGEGRYEKSERVVQQLLGVDRELASVEGAGVEAAADWTHLHARDLSRLLAQRPVRVSVPSRGSSDHRAPRPCRSGW
jgi:hypothetical protein